MMEEVGKDSTDLLLLLCLYVVNMRRARVDTDILYMLAISGEDVGTCIIISLSSLVLEQLVLVIRSVTRALATAHRH